MKYKVVKVEDKYFESAIQRLERQIEDWSKMGWKPQGGISIALEPHSDYQVGTCYCFVQAMVKED